MRPIISVLKRFAFDEKLKLIQVENVLHCSADSKDAFDKIESYKVLIDFLYNNLTHSITENVFLQFGNVILTEILKLIRKNPELLCNDEKSAKNIISHIHDSLIRIEEHTEWRYDGSEMIRIISDENIFTVLTFESMMQRHILQIRKITKSQWKEVVTVNMKVKCEGIDKSTTSSQKNISTVPKESAESTHDEDWGWDDDDDGWGDELDLDSNDVSLEVSKSAIEGLAIFDEFEKDCDKIGRDKIQSFYQYKFNLLQTTFFAMSTTQSTDWTQLYKNIKYMCSVNRRITQLLELNTRFLDINVNLIKKFVYKMVIAQLNHLKDNDTTPNWDITLSSLIPYIKKEALPVLFSLDDNSIPTFFITFVVHDLVLANILHWKIISERNSENLSEFITLLLSALEAPRLNLMEPYRHSREKLLTVSKILTAHLKDILNMFYEGEFFLFDTDEIVQWIILLFADTPTRRECIDEIRKVREEAEL